MHRPDTDMFDTNNLIRYCDIAANVFNSILWLERILIPCFILLLLFFFLYFVTFFLNYA